MRLEDFTGDWLLSREIAQADGSIARFEGRACFAPDAQGLAYHEEGVLHLPGQAPIRGSRAYLWRSGPEGIRVLFADGRPFHDFLPQGAPAEGAHNAVEASHWCDPDDYRVRYDFSGWPRWRSVWRVRGPRKDYEMTSHYSREGCPPSV